MGAPCLTEAAETADTQGFVEAAVPVGTDSTHDVTVWVLTQDRYPLSVGLVPARRTPPPEAVLLRRVALGRRMRELRTAAGLSQDQLADRIGMERRSIQRYERGERDPRFSDLVLIADALGVSVVELVR